MVRNIFVVISVALFLCSCAGSDRDITQSIKPEDPYNSVFGEAVVGENSFEAMIADNSENDDFLAEEDSDEPEWLEYINRFTFDINDGLYEYVLDPISDGYQLVVSDDIQAGIDNITYNIVGAPERFFAALGLAKFKVAGLELGKTIINIITFGGIFPSVDIGNIADDEDFGQMFASWGVPEGYFVVVPLLGPTTFRDAAGTVLASQLNPVSFIGDLETVITVTGVSTMNEYEEGMVQYNELKKAATDEYTAVKNAYLQNRREQLRK